VSSTRYLTDQEEYDLALGGAWIAFARLHGTVAIFVARSDGTLYEFDEWTNRSSVRICDLADESSKDRGEHVLTPKTIAEFRKAIDDRDAIAHSMVASDATDSASKLWRFKKDSEGHIDRDQVLTADWLDSFRRRCSELRQQVKVEERNELGTPQNKEMKPLGTPEVTS